MGVFWKTLKWLLGILVVLLITCIIIGFFLARQYKPLLAKALRKEVSTSSKGLYKLEFEDLNIEPLLGRISLGKVKLIADTSVYKQQQIAGYAPQSIYNIEVNSIRISGISAYEFYRKKNLMIDRILISNPDIKIVKNLSVKEFKKNPFKKDLYDIISPFFKGALVNSIRVEDGKVFYELIDVEKKRSHLGANNFSLFIDGLRVDKHSEADSSRFFYSDNIRFIVNNYQLQLPDSLNTIKFEQLQVSTQDSSVMVSNFHFQPRYGKYAYAKAAGKQTDHLDLRIDTTMIKGIHFRSLLFDEKLIVEHIDFLGLQLHAFRDKRVAMGNEKVKVMFHEMLKNTSFPISVSSASVQNGKVEYEEFAPRGKTPGTVFFSSLNVSFKNITNNDSAMQKNMLVDVSTYFMGVGELNIQFIFPIAKSDHTFKVNGSLGRMDLQVVNKVIESLAMVKLKKGRVNHLDFAIKANDVNSTIRMKFLYSDLDVTILDPKTGEKKGLASTLFNAILLDSDNPTKGEGPRIVNASFVRNQQKQIFNFLWKTLFQGIKPSIGVNVEDENKLKELSVKYTDHKKKVLARRADRKHNRQEKRQKRKSKKELKQKNAFDNIQ